MLLLLMHNVELRGLEGCVSKANAAFQSPLNDLLEVNVYYHS
jgi:hypothetical protein